jgi:hypothetical protein
MVPEVVWCHRSTHLEAKYVELAAKAPDWLQKRLEGVSKHAETNVTVRVFQKPAEASLRFYQLPDIRGHRRN